MVKVVQTHSNQAPVSGNVHKVLSTKLLPIGERTRLRAHNIQVKEVAFIEKHFRQPDLSFTTPVNALFTSVQAVKSLQHNGFNFAKIKAAYCVGGKTAVALNHLGVTVAVAARSAHELGKVITANYRQHKFVAFVGNLRRDELFELLAGHQVAVTEVVVYDTVILPKLLGEQFDRVLFFSPSGVRGYVEGGNTTHAAAYCLGDTTASEAKKYFNRVHTAPEPQVKVLVDYLIADIKDHA